MRVFDMFTYYCEDDMLEIRLKYLSDVVDYFVIVESDHTFSGKPKEYNMEKVMDRFIPWKSKIIYLQIKQDPTIYEFKDVDRYDPTNGPFLMESQMRNSFHIIDYMINRNDIVMIGDIDEIPNIARIGEYKERVSMAPSPDFIPLRRAMCMSYHSAYVNNICVNGPDKAWKGTVILPGEAFKQQYPQQIRDSRNTIISDSDGGWHLTYMNGVDSIVNKIQSFAHTEFDRPEIIDKEAILKRVHEGKDILGRSNYWFEKIHMDFFPEDLRSILQQYPNMIL